MHYKLFGGRASTAQTRRSLQHFPDTLPVLRGGHREGEGKGRDGVGRNWEGKGGKGERSGEKG